MGMHEYGVPKLQEEKKVRYDQQGHGITSARYLVRTYVKVDHDYNAGIQTNAL